MSNQCFNDCLDVLLISNDFTNHYVYFKDFSRLMFNKTRPKGKKYFYNHKKDCLLINGGQNIKLEKRFIEFKNFNRQIPVPFKIYADIECL